MCGDAIPSSSSIRVHALIIRGAAEVIFGSSWVVMIFQVVLQNNIVNESLKAFPRVLRKWRRQCQMEAKIGIRLCELLKVVRIKDLLFGTCSIPEADSPGAAFSLAHPVKR
jgi:hypothetical protein